MDLQMQDQVVLVTGASAGIGREAARMFAQEGALVAIAARASDRLDAAVAELEQITGVGRAVAVAADLAVPGEPERVVAQVAKELGSISVLVNNIGYAYQADFEELTDSQWDDLWQLNVMSYVRATRAVLPAMRERQAGVIINVASTAGKRPSPGMPNYSVTKAAVLSLSRLIADTYASHGIRSVAICPGPTTSEAWVENGGLADQVAERKGISHAEALAATGAGRPLGRMATPEEIAASIVFAASPRSSYTTGAAISVDGGSVPVII
jgi:NAD(P)-dependent dehydrogenase (short-subunit alcohol dehydrogenase family)